MTIKHRTWPEGCSHPNSCERHEACLYSKCIHEGKPIKPSILQLQK